MALTEQLYDKGEENWELKLHIECGPVYLEGYKNVAPYGLHPYQKPELAEANKATIKDYWARLPDGSPYVKMLDPKKTAVDILSDMRELPYGNAVDKIVCIESFASLTVTDAKKALLNWWNAMKTGAILIISVPDPAETEKLLAMWPGLNVYGLRHALYTEKRLRQILTGHGFVGIERLENIHFYPAIVLKARRGDPWVPGREYQSLPELSPGWRILDVGPGAFPLEAATDVLDISTEFRARKSYHGKQFFKHDLQNGLPFSNDEFDFVYCSHVLEHLDRPIAGLEEIQRVGRRGFVEVPSILLDFIMKHGTTHPKWACWGPGGDVLLFIEKTEAQNRLFLDFDSCWGAFFHHAMHGVRLSAPQQAIRFFFWQNQCLLNIAASWDKEEGQYIAALEMRL